MKQSQHLHPDKVTPQKTQLLYRNWREGFATPLLVGTLIFSPLALIPALLSTQNPYLDAVFITVYLLIGLVTFVRFPYEIRIGVFLLTLYALGVSELFSTGVLGDALFFFLAFITLSTMLLSPRAGIGAIALSLATFGITGTLSLTEKMTFINPSALLANTQDWLSATVTILLVGAIILLGFQRLELEFSQSQEQVDNTLDALKEERNNLEKNVTDRTRKLRQVNEISRTISSILDPEELPARAVHLIGSEFDCYYTALFLLDNTGQWAGLKQATGDAGRILRENKYRLDARGKSLIAMAVQTAQPQLALETSKEPIRSDNPLLRYTRSQVTLPLIIGGRVLGALDMQSTRTMAFNTQDLDTLQNMANQIAIAMENARLFEAARQSLLEMQATQRQYLHNAWTTLASEEDLEYRLGDGEITDQTREIEVPLALRDQIIGQISLSINDEWTPEQRNVVEAIATQAALALENARLVEESQSTAAREKLTNEIIAKVWSSVSVDAIMQTAVREVGRALDASEVSIEISSGEVNE